MYNMFDLIYKHNPKTRNTISAEICPLKKNLKQPRLSRTGDKMPTIVHFEIPADNVERASKFYSGLFGWEIKNVGNPSGKADGDYWMVSTTNDKGECSIGGGILKRKGAFHVPTNYIGVPNVEEAAKKVQELGGKILMGKTAVPGMGYFICCLDSEHNQFSLWEENKEAKSSENDTSKNCCD